MWWQTKKTHLFCLTLALILLAGCGYTMRGQEGNRTEDSVLGTGSKTLKIKDVEQTTLYPWLPYLLRSQLRDEITARGLAKWVDDGVSDYDLLVKVKNFRIRSYGQSREQNLLFTASMELELVLYSGMTNTAIWNSGPISYSETYENVNEERAVREINTYIVRRAVDRLQQKF